MVFGSLPAFVLDALYSASHPSHYGSTIIVSLMIEYSIICPKTSKCLVSRFMCACWFDFSGNELRNAQCSFHCASSILGFHYRRSHLKPQSTHLVQLGGWVCVLSSQRTFTCNVQILKLGPADAKRIVIYGDQSWKRPRKDTAAS